MSRLFKCAIVAFLFLASALPADATVLASIAVTTAVTAQTSVPLQFLRGPPSSVAIQASFVYGSGGTSTDAYVQTSLDSGQTWIDIAQFHFATSTARFVYNLSALTPVTTELTPKDGALGANTSQDGIIGSMMRTKLTTVGTYAGGTSLVISLSTRNYLGP